MQLRSQSVILIVDDNKDILFHLKLLLEKNEYIVKTAIDGKDALKILLKLETIPDLIISDIMMPEMDGYDFFKTISNNSKWNRIPFLFLTAKSTPKDIRLGKMLGVDDYITKPFKNEDLLASISGKITRNKKSHLLDKEIDRLLSSSKIGMRKTNYVKDQMFLCLLLVYWNDLTGPTLERGYPSDKNLPFSIKAVGKQLFHAATSIYGHDKITKAQGILLHIENINNIGYLFFDSFPDDNERYGEKQYMLAVITPMLNYFLSLKIKELLKEISEKVKKKLEWDIIEYWEKIFAIVSEESVLLHS